MKTHNVNHLFTIGNNTGLQFNYEGNTYKVDTLSDIDRENLLTLINNNLEIEYVRIQDDGFVKVRNKITETHSTHSCTFQIELTDDYMVESERREIKSRHNINSFKDAITSYVNRLSIEKYGVHIVANWEDGGSDAVTDDIHTTDDFFKAYPDAISRDVFDFFAGIRDGITVRTWVDDHNRIATDTVYYIGDITTDKNEVLYLLDDDIFCFELSIKVKNIFADYS